MSLAEAYPLSWPPGFPRTEHHERKCANFSKQTTRHGQYGSWRQKSELSVHEATSRLVGELERLGAQNWVLSTDLELRKTDGLPRSGQRNPDDPGVAVYFLLNDKPHCLPCDRWDRIADNIAAIAKHIEAARGQERWGVGDVARAFAGFQALPDPNNPDHFSWRSCMGYGPTDRITTEELAARYKKLAINRHPDTPTGSHEMMADLNRAYAMAKKELEN